MSPKWLNSLVRARQLQEDAAKQHLATAERLARRAHDRARVVDERLDSLVAVEAERSVPAFVAAAAALQAVAASHAAARQAAAQAEGDVARNREQLGNSARRRMGAEELLSTSTDHDIVGSYRFAIRTNDLNIRRRIDLPKNFGGRPSSRNDRWLVRNDAPAGMECFGNKKLGGDVSLAYVFFECCGDQIVIVRVHGESAAARYV